MKYCVLYNPKSGDNANLKARLDATMFGDEFYYISMPEVTDFKAFFEQITDNIIICGGDGTLNYFINKIAGIPRRSHLFYFDTGSGNDFHTDVCGGERPYSIDIYLENLPIVRFNNQNVLMLNGAGCGLDSYACFEGEKQRAKDHKPINYAKYVKRGLFGGFKPYNARITVDGAVYNFDKIWVDMIMNGKFIGGGIKIAPMQNRLNNSTLSLIIGHTKSRVGAFGIFPSVLRGSHIKNTKTFQVLQGKYFKIECDRAMPLQVDGEIFPDVSSFEVFATKQD